MKLRVRDRRASNGLVSNGLVSNGLVSNGLVSGGREHGGGRVAWRVSARAGPPGRVRAGGWQS